jgi:excinuclease ABC subunit B
MPPEEKEVKQLYNKKDKREEIEKKIKQYRKEMRRAAKELRFEDAAHLRDQLRGYESLEILE